jgi:hypothetical protein
MKNIETIDELENKFGVQTGDLVMCTYNFTSWKDKLDFAVGLYDPYQGINNRRLGLEHVDFFEGARQREDLVKSKEFFRIHLFAHSQGKKEKLYNAGHHLQIPVISVKDFELILKAKEITNFYKISAQK